MIRKTLVLLAFIFPAFLSPLPATAQLSFQNPESTTVESCNDYFTSEWASPLDMSDSTDVPCNILPLEVQDILGCSFSNGLFSTTATGNDPHFNLLTKSVDGSIADTSTRYGDLAPINTSYYKTLTFRMYSSAKSDYQVLWQKNDDSLGQTDAYTISEGWRTYSLDLSQEALNFSQGSTPEWSASEALMLRLDPNRNLPGTETKIDWVQLTPSSCDTLDIKYSAAVGEAVSLYVDDNGSSSPSDGYQQRSEVIAATGGTQTKSFSSNLFFPGSYSVYGFATRDYATSYMDPWDMGNSEDVDSTRIYNVSSPQVSNGAFTGTASTADANFYLNLPDNSTIDASVFNKLSIALTLSGNSTDRITIMFFDTSLALKGSTYLDISPTAGVEGIYNINLAGVSGWNGQIGSLRINPTFINGRSFSVNWIGLGSAYQGSLTTPTIVTYPTSYTVSKRRVAPIVQPDIEGGEDYFVKVRGKASNMSSVDDIQYLSGVSSASIYPASAYTDSGGKTFMGDYFQGINDAGNGDPQNFSLFVDTAKPIDPDLYKITCFTLDNLHSSMNVYHSVARVLWQRNHLNVNGDDIVLKTTGEARYCVRLDTMQLEPPLAAGQTHPWHKNDDGTGINYWRIDPHEEEAATSYRIADIRIATDHQAGSRFAVVVGGDRDQAVSLYYTQTKGKSGGALIANLPANRTSDVVLWDTSNISPGTYWLYTSVGGISFLSPAPVVIDSSYSDTESPNAALDAPKNDSYIFNNEIEIAGYAVDNVRIAAVEVVIDGELYDRFLPSDFNKTVRDSFPAYPMNSSAAFQRFIDTKALSYGSHTFALKVYDTSGNTTTLTRQVTRSTTGTTDPISYPIPNDSPVAVTNPATPVPSPTLGLSLSIKGATIKFTVTGINTACNTLRLYASDKSTADEARTNDPSYLLVIEDPDMSSLTGEATITKVPPKLYCDKKGKLCTKLPADTYFYADCGDGLKATSTKINYKKLKFKKVPKSLPTLKKWWDGELKGRFKRTS